MKRAWEIARKGQEKFGGKVSEYLSEALKMAWAEVNQDDKPGFVGSEKQIKWANDIYPKVVNMVDELIAEVEEYAERKSEATKNAFNRYVELVNEMKQETKAGFWIDRFGYVKTHNDVAYWTNQYVLEFLEEENLYVETIADRIGRASTKLTQRAILGLAS